jgi:choice-of-anchor A domain-containing protein
MIHRLACPALRITAVAACALAAGTSAASAGPLTAQTLLADFNVITIGDLTTTNDVEGAAVIGGNLGGTPNFFNTDVPGTTGFPGSPVVYLYGNNNTTSMNIDGGGTLVTSPPNPLSAYTAPLIALSTQLAGTAANATGAPDGSGNFVFKYTGTGSVAAFSFTGAALAADLSGKSVQFSLGSATMAVVNVTGNFTAPGDANFNAPALRNVIFNFEDATEVDVGNWEASILAPDAEVDITGGGHIEGSLFADSFEGGGELHNYTFTATLPSPPSPPTSSVPEPPTLWLVAAGLVGLVLRRPRASAEPG